MAALRISRTQKKALIICAAFMMIVGVLLTLTGFVFNYHPVYDKLIDPSVLNVHHIMYPCTQYWLGIPVFLLGIYVFISTFYSSSMLYLIALVLCTFFMVASFCAVGLHVIIWYIALDIATAVNNLQCWTTSGPQKRCKCAYEVHLADGAIHEYENLLTLMTCAQVRAFPGMVSALVIFSALAFFACQATCFVYIKILRWLDSEPCGEITFSEAMTGSRHILVDNEQSM